MKDVETLLDRLRRAGKKPKRSLLNQVKALGPAAVGPLIEMATDERLHNADVNKPEVWAPIHAINLLGELGAAEAVEPLLPLLAWDDDWLHEALPHCFGQIGRPALEPLRRALFDRDGEIWGPVRAAAGLREIAEHHPELRGEAIAALASRLDPSETRRPDDETLNAYVVSELCDLKAVEAADAVRRAYAEDRVDLRVIGPDHLGELGIHVEPSARDGERRGLRLWLRCTACEFERPHDLEKVYVDLDMFERRGVDQPGLDETFAIPQTITCPKCGAVDRYKLAADAYLTLMTEMLGPALGISIGEAESPEEKALIVAPFGLKDRRALSAQEAREIYRQDVAADPSNADLRLRLANVLIAAGERAEAASELRAALRLDPTNAEACLRLGELAREDGNDTEARRLFERALDLVPDYDVTDAKRRQVERAARTALAQLETAVPAPASSSSLLDEPGPTPLVPEPYAIQQPVRVGPKVGRNEPCPCGSGRKYKRCCGR